MPQDPAAASYQSSALLCPGCPEITAASGFLSSLLRGRVSESRLRGFGGAMAEALADHYKHHWFPDKPSKGSGHRCIRINHKMDPIIGKVASQIGLTRQQLFTLLPRELTLWVDPFEVSYQIGEDASICVLYEAAALPLVPPAPSSTFPLLTCKEEIMMGCTSPSKNYMLTAAS